VALREKFLDGSQAGSAGANHSDVLLACEKAAARNHRRARGSILQPTAQQPFKRGRARGRAAAKAGKESEVVFCGAKG